MKGRIQMGASEALKYLKKREDVEPYLRFCAYISAAHGTPRTYGDKQLAIERQRQLFKSLLKTWDYTYDYDPDFFEPFLAILYNGAV